jgi:hypothetical protein
MVIVGALAAFLFFSGFVMALGYVISREKNEK